MILEERSVQNNDIRTISDKALEIPNALEKDAFQQAIERTGGVMSGIAALPGQEAPAFRKAVKERHPKLIG